MGFHKKQIISLVAFLLFNAPAFSSELTPEENQDTTKENINTAVEVDDAILRTDYWYFSYAQMQASDDFQREELVGENIQVFELGYNWRFSKYGNVVLGFDFLVVDDESKVEVKVSYEGGSTATEDSEIKGFAVPIEIGASYITDNNKIELGANVGYRFFILRDLLILQMDTGVQIALQMT